MDFVKLRKTGAGWEFETEGDLEDFVWVNLKELFGFTPLKRQYYIKGQYCDILALAENKQLVVLELKNDEDRYIVQQLTRYYDAVREEKPFQEQIDYEKPIGLIAITPSFHRDNFTDRKYNHLSIQFLQFGILVDGEKFYLHLKDLDTGKVSELEIPYQPIDFTEEPHNYNKIIRNLLSKCNENEQEGILKIRSKILSFDKRMQELADTGSIKYGKNKNICAEFRFDNERNRPVLFLWLPLVIRRLCVGRMRIWTDWKTVSDIAYVPKGVGKLRTRSEVESDTQIHRYKRKYNTCCIKSPYNSKSVAAVKFTQYVDGMKYYGTKENYLKILEIQMQSDSLEMLVDLALEKWIQKL